MWSNNKIACVTTNTIFEYWCKHYGTGSEYGIDGGKISKLTIRKHGEYTDLLHYDRAWDVHPSEEVQAIYEILLAKYN